MAKIIFFSPNSAIWSFAYPEALIAEALKEENNSVVYITCGEVFSDYCTSMSAYQIPYDATKEEKEKICGICIQNKFKIKQQFGLNGYDLKTVLNENDFEEIKKIVKSLTQKNFKELKVDGIKIGQVSLFEFLLNHKKITFDFSEKEWEEALIAIKNALISFFAARKIISKEKPDAIVTYGAEYSANNAFCLAGQSNSIPFYTMEAGGNLRHHTDSLNISKNYMSSYFKQLGKHWQQFKNIPADAPVLGRITNHFLELLNGVHFFAYSSKKSDTVFDLRKKYGIRTGQKILVATMSSYDERIAGEFTGTMVESKDAVFPNQIEWISAVIDYVKTRAQLFFIIRVHPREFPNKRDALRSEHSLLLEKLFVNLPSNVVVNWPTDNISLYDIAGETDVFLNAWSSVGKEMSLFGIPVVLYNSDLVFYCSDINYVGKSKEDFFTKIEQALIDGWSFERVRTTYRWYAIEHKYAQLDISERYPPKARKLNFFTRVYRRGIWKLLPESLEKFIEADKLYVQKHSKPLASRKEISKLINGKYDTLLNVIPVSEIKKVNVKDETFYLKAELKKLLDALYPKFDSGVSAPNSLIKNFKSVIES